MAVEKKKIVYNSLTGMFEVSLDVSGMADTADIAATYIPLSQKGVANGVVPLDAGGKISAAFLPNSVMELQGFYNASTNTPTLADGVGNPGDVYEIDVAGTVDLGSGNLNLKVGDWVVYAADGKWHKSINSNEVVSVNGLTGAVTLTTSNINEGSNLYYTSARFDSAFASKTTDNLSEGITNLYFTNTRARQAVVSDSIVDSVTDIAPSQNAVFDALAFKADTAALGNKANITLDNLSSTSISADLIPDADASNRLLGSSSIAWGTGYIKQISTSTGAQINTLLRQLQFDGTAVAEWFNNGIKILSGKILRFTSGDGTGAIGLKAPATVTSIDYTLPVSAPTTVGKYLTTKTDGTMLWSNINQDGDSNLIKTFRAADEVVSPFNLYNDGATNRPVDGVGGTPTISTGMSSLVLYNPPIYGNSSFYIAKGAGNMQGNGVSIDFPVELGYRGKSLKISFDYLNVLLAPITPGTSTTDGDWIVYIYDVTNSKLIEPSNIKLFSDSATLSDRYEGTFQTSIDGSQYRLILHLAGTTAASMGLKIDNISIKANQSVYGVNVTAWTDVSPSLLTAGSFLKAITTNPTYGGVTKNAMRWRQVGEDYEVEWDFGQTTAGTAGSGSYYLDISNLPFRPDTSKIVFNDSDTPNWQNLKGTVVGTIQGSASNTGGYQGNVYFRNSTRLQVILRYLQSGTFPTTAIWGNAAPIGQLSLTDFQITIKLKFKGAGLAASTRISDGYDGRQLIACGYGTATGINTSGVLTKILLTSLNIASNDASMINVSNNRVDIKSSGKYTIKLDSSYTNGVNAVSDVQNRIYVNGSPVGLAQSISTTYGKKVSNFIDIDLKSGDYVEFYAAGSAGYGGTQDYIFSVAKLQSPQTISESERIFGSYDGTAGNIIDTTDRTLICTTKREDTHGLYNTSNGRITANKAGTIDVTAVVMSNYTAATHDLYIQTFKNGTLYHQTLKTVQAGSANQHQINDSIPVVAGDYIEVKYRLGAGSSNIATSNSQCYINFKYQK